MQPRRDNSSAMGAADEVKELKQQVEKLRERLDFMAPMLSLLTFTQDYFQRVECEASVQLMRLKNARLAESASVEGSADKEEQQDPNSMETARWLHTMTDLMIGLGGQSSLNSARAPSSTTATPPPEPSLQPRPALLRVENLLDDANDSEAMNAKPLEGLLREGQPRLSSSHRRSPPQFGGKVLGPEAIAARSELERKRASFESLRGGTASMPMPSPESSARGDNDHDGLPLPAAQRWQRVAQLNDPSPHPGSIVRSSPQPAQGRSVTTPLESTLEFGGLALGRGTWANAYRQATGLRRDALRLLCATGIVTERELADDLTVISEEHIDECVSIAAEMLQRWPTEHGPPPQQEAKRFFEERLAALYMKRAPSPFGLT